MLIRTIWLTSICLATLAGLFAAELVSGPILEPVEAADSQAAIDLLRGTLTKADRLASAYVIPADEASSVPVDLTAAQAEPIKPEPAEDAAEQLRPAATANKVSVMLPRPRPKSRPARTPGRNETERSRTASEDKTCRQQDPIASFLAAAGIAPRCET